MRIVISPDKFKGTLTAAAAAAAIASGVRSVRPEAALSLCPMADGGEGTLATLIDALGGTRSYVSACDPWGDPARLPVGVFDDGRTCIETAWPRLGDPLRADSRGVGLLIAAAAQLHPGTTTLVGVGGTVSTDGGAGLARSLGWTFEDGDGNELPAGGGALRDLQRLVPPDPRPVLDVVALCDVDAPLTGPLGSAMRFAPQKGADGEGVLLLERGLRQLVEIIRRDIGVEVERLPGAGAGGGIGAGIVAFCGGTLRSGFGFVADAVGLRSRVAEADLVITGEGRFDEQSLQGKVTVEVARVSQEVGVPCVGLFGQLAAAKTDALEAGFSDVVVLADRVGSTDTPAARLAAAAATAVAHRPP